MNRSAKRAWRAAIRAFCVPMLAWLLVAHSILFPVGRALAIEAQGVAPQIAMLCLSDNLGLAVELEGVPTQHAHDDLGCCPLVGTTALDVPALAPFFLAPMVPSPLEGAQIVFDLPQSRAPPAITATPAQSRAPPFQT